MSFLPSSRILRAILAVIGIVLTVFLVAPELVIEYFWMEELDYEGVFWTIRGTQVVLFLLVFVVAALYFGVNFNMLLGRIPPLWASRWSEGGEAPQLGGKPLTRDRLKRVAYVIAGLLSLLFATGFSGRWNDLLRFWYAGSYGEADPVYGYDLAFHMLELPFLQALQSAVVGLAFLGLLALATGYVIAGEIGVQDGQIQVSAPSLRHVGVNIILLLLGWTWGFYLDRYEMLQEGGGTVYGAGYTDINAVLPALWVMIVATLVLAGLVAYNLYKRDLRLLGYGVVGYLVLLLVGLVAIPSLVTQLTVLPSELDRERPYLQHNIDMTREAYNLEEFTEHSYAARPTLSPTAIEDNQETIDNVRLWDPRLLIDTYRQLQEIRLYYEFYNVDVDRYTIDGDYRQTMMSARELTQQLPEDTWDNRHVRFTHGYGSVANLVAREGTGGDPDFLIKDIPPQTEHEALDVEDPSLYYGERTPHYRIVPADDPNGDQPLELHYPKSGENVYTRYEGDGGVNVGSFWKQLLFSYYMGDFNILLTEYISDDSQIQFWNRVGERVRRVAPFLSFDRDPYIVAGDDRHYWIQDAYTTSSSFPYSEPIRNQQGYEGTRYIRNSVKIVVDAYDGDVSLYVSDPTDPIIRMYQEVFPDLFQPLDAMPETLRDHIRYPQDYFEMQVDRYRRYHQTQPRVFYNNEDLWTRPQEQYAGRERTMEPYYILTDLPGEQAAGLEFMLMLPMTPDGRDNMISWIAARSDPPNYGEVVVYELPKDRLIRGPNQIESRIDQDTQISQQLSLWDQRGSNVIRGNLIVVPIEDSFLYVEPIFLLAQDIQIPEMQRVIAANEQRVAMEPTLRQSINAIMGETVAPTREEALAQMEEAAGAAQAAAPEQVEGLERAKELIQEAREALSGGNFGTFGDRFDELESVLDEIPLPDTTAVPSSPPTESSGTP